jgi:stage IV sporulation protein B
MALDVGADMISGFLAVGALAFAPVTGGASLLVAAGVGAATKATIKAVAPGEYSMKDLAYDSITGSINGTKLGEISSNTEYGLSGTVQSPIEGTDLATADSRAIRLGNASILADVDGEGIKEYSIKIKQLSPCSSAGKDMIIEITDKELIKKTGGIIQGMSGSPILQNGRIVGAVTHVFVNDPTRGYGIFIENMLSEAEKIK